MGDPGELRRHHRTLPRRHHLARLLRRQRPELGGRRAGHVARLRPGPYPAGLVSTPLFGETLMPVSRPEVASQINNPDDLLNYVLIEPSAHETTWAHVLGLPVLPSATRVIKVESTLLALELAANNGGIALARPPATDILVPRLGLTPCLDGFSIVGSEAYHILHYANPSLTREAAAFKKWLMELH